MKNKYLQPKLFVGFIMLLLTTVLCACGNSIDTASMPSSEILEAASIIPDTEPATSECETETLNEIKVEVETEPQQKEPSHNLKDIDWETFQAQLSDEDAETLQKYLPVLTGGEFTWIERHRDSDNADAYLHKSHQAVIQDIHLDCDQPDTHVSTIAFADVFQSGTQDVILYLYNMGGHYLILHEENGIIYGIDYPARWFQGLQEDGLYCGSGGVSYQRFYRMTFTNGDYTEHLICILYEGEFYIGDEKQGTTHEEAWELFDAWFDTNMQNDVKWHSPLT